MPKPKSCIWKFYEKSLYMKIESHLTLFEKNFSDFKNISKDKVFLFEYYQYYVI